MELADRVVIVTGASSGIGAATARLAHDAGARVVLAARRRDRLDALCQSLPGSLAVPTDITRAGDRERLLRRTLEQFGGVDVLVNNAGQGLHVPLLQVSEEDFMAVLALNLVAPLALIQLVVPAMCRRGGGAVVNVSSATSNLVIPGLGAYAATKAALDRISLVAQRELAPLGIRVSLVHPGVTATEFHQSLRAGEFRGRPNGPPPDPPELVAAAIAEAIRSGSGDLEAGRPSR